MDLLQAPPSGYDAVAKAFAMAKHLPTTHRRHLRIGLADGNTLFAVGQLDGHRQVSFLREHLRALGWHEHLLGGDDDMHGCDMLFSAPQEAAAGNSEDPSFIRRTPVELWGTHAGEPST